MDVPAPFRDRVMRAARPVTMLIGLMGAAGIWTAGATPASLEKVLQSDARSPVAVSVAFAPLEAGGTQVELDPGRLLPPASVEKIVTSAAALDIHGPSYHFTTRLSTDGTIRGDRIEGNLYLTGDGDPFLVSERLWLLARSIAARGIHTVTGDLVIGASRITDLDSIRTSERSDSPYTASVSLLAVNFNNVAFVIRPGTGAGEPATVLVDPFPVPGVAIANRLVTGARGSAATVSGAQSAGVWTFQGAIPADAPPTWVYKAAPSPSALAGSVLNGLLTQNGIQVAGRVREGLPPSSAVPVDSLQSLQLGALVRSMNGWSNNFMADLLLVTLGDGKSARSGLAEIRRWLRERPGIDPLPVIRDGSGLSVVNRISAADIVQILSWASREERVFPDLYASLARPREEGTLQKRFRSGPPIALRAKTGTLGDIGVSSIAGYVDLPAGRRYAFCILQRSQDPNVSVADLRDREERWLRELVAP